MAQVTLYERLDLMDERVTLIGLSNRTNSDWSLGSFSYAWG